MARQFTLSSTQGFGADNVSLLDATSSTALSFAAWVYADTFIGVLMDIEQTAQGWGLGLGAGGVVLLYTRGANSGNQNLATGLGAWFHLGAVYDQGNDVLRIYENGTELYSDTSYTDVSAVTNPELGIGISYRGGTNIDPMDGRMCEVGFWSGELEPNYFAMLAAGISPIRTKPENLLLYYPLFGRVSPEKDFSGNNVDLTATTSAPTLVDHAPVGPMFGFDEQSSVAVAADISHVAALAESFDNVVQRRPIKVTSF